MKKTLLVIVLVVALATVSSAVFHAFYYLYAILGRVNDATDGSGMTPEKHMVCFYKNETELLSGIYSFDYVGTTGSTGQANLYSINAFQTTYMNLTPGQTCKAAVVRDAENYGAGPVDVTYTGSGFDAAPDMTMAYGAGIDPPPSQIGGAKPPRIKEVQFDNRVYHKILVEEKGEQFIIAPGPVIKLYIEETPGYGINAESIQIVLDEGSPEAKTIDLSAENITKTVQSAAIVTALEVEYSVAEEDLREDGDHKIKFIAFNHTASASTSEVCTVTILSGPAAVIGPVIVHPTPYSPPSGDCTIQYTLTVDANIEIYIYSIAGELVKRIYGRKGAEGGSAGVNKVAWNGRTTFGEYAGNGGYAGTVYDVDQGKTLAKFKLAILHQPD